jgi:hypothetical protein
VANVGRANQFEQQIARLNDLLADKKIELAIPPGGG